MSKKNKQNQMQRQADFPRSEWEGRLIKTIKYLSVALLFVPLFNIKIFFYPFVFVKLLTFYGVIEFIGALYVILVFLDRKYLPAFVSGNGKSGKKKNWIFIFLTAYLAIAAFTNFFSVNPYLSFFGSINWNSGLLTLLHFFLFFVVLSSIFKKEDCWLIFFRWNSGVGFFVALVGLYQKIVDNVAVPMGTFGNPAHLSAYLIFTFFGALFLYFWEKQKGWKIFEAAAAVASVAVIFYITDIRGSQLGMVLGIIAIGFFFFLGNENSRVRKITFCSAVLGAVLLVALAFYSIKTEKVYSLFQRSYTVKTRLIAWEAGLKGLQERPWIGYGMENFIAPFEKYFNPQYYDQGTGSDASEYGMDQPHNKLIEVAVTNGIFALLAYLSLFASIYLHLHKKYRETREKKYPALAGLFTAYLVNIFFLFDNIITLQMFFLFLAYLNADFPNLAAPKTEPKKKTFFILVPTLAILYLFAFYYLIVKPISANLDSVAMLTSGKDGRFEESMAAMDRLEKRNVYWIQIKAIFEQIQYARKTFVEKTQWTETEKEFVRKVSAAGENNIRRNPYNFYYYVSQGFLDLTAGNFDQKYFRRAAELMEDIIGKGTQRLDAYVILSDAYGALGEKEKISALEETALKLDPDYSYAYFAFGGVHLRLKEFDQASDLFEKAIALGCITEKCYLGYADANIERKNFPKAIAAYEEIVKLVPNAPQMQANLAMLYFNNNEFEKALALAESIKKKFPAAEKQINAFLNKFPK